jgi:formylglycine-generating enzyme required for sulfatase activity
VPEVTTATRGGVELVRVPGGRFWMGSADGDPLAWDDEKPRHALELASFWLARTPITNAQYREYVQANPRVKAPAYWGDPLYDHDDQPVVGVSWHEAAAYCKWAGLVLPTEAQWEYACRAGTTGPYHGEDPLALGWYEESSGRRLHAVGERPPNAWGLHDMHGNVWEWCRDALESYEVSPRAQDGLRKEPRGGTYRMVRGGLWFYPARYARSASRFRIVPASRLGFVGFRPARGPQ